MNTNYLEIIFENRNKSYGAYELRKNYSKRIKIGIAITIILFLFLSIVFATKTNYEDKKYNIDVIDTKLGEIKKDVPVQPKFEMRKKILTPKTFQIKFTTPKIVDDNKLISTEKIEEIADNQNIGNEKIVSKNEEIIKPIEPIITEVEKEEDNIFTKVEIESQYPGGNAKWFNYLINNLNFLVSNGAPPGTYTIIIKFIVDKDGAISDVMAESNFGYGMEEESIRVIKNSGKWSPAIQNGRQVSSFKRQPITWVIEE